MGYPEKSLNPGEQIAIDVRPHWKYLAGPIFAVAVVVVGSVVALAEAAPHWAELALAVLLVVCLLWLLGRYTRWVTTSFVVTNDRLILRKGILRHSVREILLDRLTDITYNQTLFDRILGCGDILLESPGRDSQEVFPDLPHPVRIQNEIYRLINERRPGAWVAGTGDPAAASTSASGSRAAAPGAGFAGSAAGAAPSAPGASPSPAPFAGVAATDAPGGREASVADQLSQLDDLRKRGVISRREFAAKKAELLSRM
jgi:membrane protein YdbS with pleckstrin-like domain